MTTMLDPTRMTDWQIADAAEQSMKPFEQIAQEAGLLESELIPMGRSLGKVDLMPALHRLENQPRGKYIDVTAITPTPLGEGKTTTTLGLTQGMARNGHKVIAAIRQPSAGPTFNIKGSAAGGGLSQCIPHSELALGLTGDIDRITNAHNLAMVALTARMQHEANYTDERLAKSEIHRRLNIDPNHVAIKWAMDFCAQALRNIRIGLGDTTDGVEMDSGFQISVSSELMAILATAQDLPDLRKRVAKMIVAYDTSGNEITTADLEVDGAIAAWLARALDPNLLQTLEGQPVFVHAGPFANIAIGQSSIVADRIGVRLGEYLITESGFGADIGFEKFWNLKCRLSGLHPDAVVIVATTRALKWHGGGPEVKPGQALDDAYDHENLGLLEEGCANLLAHIETVQASGVKPVVCVNQFATDTDEEIELIKRIARQAGANAEASDHWMTGGEGARALAEAVEDAANQPHQFEHLYTLDETHESRIEKIAKTVYGADGVDYLPEALEKLKRCDADPETLKLGVCMLKTHLSLSDDPSKRNRPTGWRLPVRDIWLFKGAELLVPVAGSIKIMPGTGSNPAYRRIDVDTETGAVQGLF